LISSAAIDTSDAAVIIELSQLDEGCMWLLQDNILSRQWLSGHLVIRQHHG